MRNDSWTPIALVGLFLCLAPAPVAAQRQVARINGIVKEIGSREEKVSGAVPNVRVRREATRRMVDPRGALTLDDHLLVDQGYHVKAKVRHRGQRGEFFFFAKARPLRVDTLVVGSTVKPGQHAEFVLRTDKKRPRNFEVEVVRGALAVRWTRGRLTVWAAGNPVSVTGTKLVFKTSSDGERAIVFRKEGRVEFPLAPDFEMTTPVVELRRGATVPIPVSWLSTELIAALDKEFVYNERDIWSRSKWPWVLAIVPAAVISVICAFECGDDAVSGTVTLVPE